MTEIIGIVVRIVRFIHVTWTFLGGFYKYYRSIFSIQVYLYPI